MSTLSLCMIVKNEERTLARCLNSIKNVVDEIVIVDTGSVDSTKLIAQKFTNKIYNFEWCDNFSKARNFSFSKASSEYILWLDADDIVPKKTAKKISELKKNLTKDIYMFKYDIGFYKNKPTFSYYRERIIKNCYKAKWQGIIHECIVPFGVIERIDYSIMHKKIEFKKSDRNLKILNNLSKQRKLTERELYYYGRELYDNGKFKKSIKVLAEFIKLKTSWVENVIDACYIVSLCYNRLQNYDKCLEFLFKTFNYDKPRANICCKIGDYFLMNNKLDIAIYWYKEAIKCENVINKGGFVEELYYNYYPYLQLCCCYYKLGNFKESEIYNEKAGKFCNDDIVNYNRKFFNQIKTDKN